MNDFGEFSLGIAVDNADNAYIIGGTDSTNFPTTANAVQTRPTGIQAAFISKLSSTGNTLIYSTLLGGSGADNAQGIAVDISGDAYVTGVTSSLDFPTINAIQPIYGGGSLDAFLTKIDPTGSRIVYSTYLGGTDRDDGDSVAVDASGSAYVTGLTLSPDFPTVNSLQPVNTGLSAYVAKLSPSGSSLVYSTYLGSPAGTVGTGIAVDATGNAYVAGVTSAPDLPIVNAIQSTLAAVNDAFVAKLDSSGGILLFSTYLGGNGDDVGRSMAIDPAGNVYVTGDTSSTDFPTANALQPHNSPSGGGSFVTKLTTPTLARVPFGQAVTISTTRTGDAPDLTATVVNNTATSGTATIVVDKFSSNPGDTNVIDVGGGFLDLRVTGADPNDSVTANFYYPSSITGLEEGQLQLLYFSSTAWLPVRSSGNTNPTKNVTDNLDNTVSGGRFTVIFDNTSTPTVTQLTGTLFTPSLTPAGDITFLIAEVGGLSLNKGQKNSLAMKLSATGAALSRGSNRVAANQIQGFINELNAEMMTGRLPATQGQPLINHANALLSQLGS